MKILVKNRLRALLMFTALVAGTLFVVNAMDSNEKMKEVEEVVSTWHFTGNDPSEILQAKFWQNGPSPNTNCQQEEVLELPCTYIANDASIGDANDLINYFESAYPLDTEAGVLEHAISTRDPQ